MISIRRGRSSAPLSSLSRLEREIESNLRVEEESEKIDVLGQESDLKAAPWVRKEFDAGQKKDQEIWEQDIEVLQHLRKQKHTKGYFRYLVQILYRFIQEEEIPKQFTIETTMSDKGIVSRIAGTKYVGAFKPSGLPSYDRNYCKVLSMKIGNTVAKLRGFRKESSGGILLPDEEDKQLYGPK